jgi:hypothetical protein
MLSFLPMVGRRDPEDDDEMFPVHCVQHGRLVLLPYGRIRVENTPVGIVVHYRCTCGHEGSERMGALASCAGERGVAA